MTRPKAHLAAFHDRARPYRGWRTCSRAEVLQATYLMSSQLCLQLILWVGAADNGVLQAANLISLLRLVPLPAAASRIMGWRDGMAMAACSSASRSSFLWMPMNPYPLD